MFALSVVSACTTGGNLTTALQSAAESEPQETAALPEAADRTQAMPVLRAAAYAGPSPSGSVTVFAPEGRFGPGAVAARSPELDALIARYAAYYDIPEELVRRVVKRESTFDPGARNGPYWGLMQIRHDTARGMGYDGPPSGLLDAETNLKYAVRYLRGAYLTAGGNPDQAVRLYARGYYYDAKARGLLEETGLKGPRRHAPGPETVAAAEPAEPAAAAAARSAAEAIGAVAPRTEPQPGR